jgi:peptide deformylase
MNNFKDVLNEQDKEIATPVDIIIGIDNINTPCTNATMEEAEKIWPVLEASLDTNIGHGLAAIQIGIPKKVAIIKYNNKVYRLLNTRMTNVESLITVWGEGCLSIPKKVVNTERFAKIEIKDDVLGTLDLNASSDGLLPIIFQHELDHFEGKTIFDHQLKPIRVEKIGRNEPCTCGSGQKYKKCCLNK